MPTYTAADGALLFYDLIGIGPRRSRAIVVIAGGVARHPSYLGDLAGLADHHELVVPHLRGVGRTPVPTLVESGAYWQQAADIESLREDLGVEQLIVVAHSAGTRVAIAYAAQHPDRVSGLLLITPPSGYLIDEPSDVDALVDDRRGEPAFDAAIVALLAGPQGSTDDSFNAWQQLTAPASYATWDGVSQAHARAGRWSLSAARAFFSTDPPPDLAERIRRVHAPVLVMAGAQDCFTGVAPQVALAALFPNGRCVVIDRSGHYPWVEQPRAFRTAADRFLDQLTQSVVTDADSPPRV